MMVRIMIVALLLGSAWLGWMAYEQNKEIERYEAALAPDGLVESTVEKIQSKAYRYTQYNERKRSEGVSGDGVESMALFVRQIARHDKVRWGAVQVGQADDNTVTIDKQRYIDTTYKVEPQEKNQSFDRTRIANFLFKLETESRKVKVTDITLEQADKVDSHEIPKDSWDVDLKITVRTRDESKKKGRG